jgi:hypothetical protein
LSGPISISSSTITAHDFNFGMGSQPFSDTFRFSIGKDIDDLMRISIDDHCSISETALPGEIIDSDMFYQLDGLYCKKMK